MNCAGWPRLSPADRLAFQRALQRQRGARMACLRGGAVLGSSSLLPSTILRSWINAKVDLLLPSLRGYALAAALRFPSARRQHQFHQRLGNLRLQALGVPFLEAHDVGHNASILALRIGIDFRFPRPRQKSPRWIRWILTGAVIDVTRFDVDDLLDSAAWATTVPREVLCRPSRVRPFRK